MTGTSHSSAAQISLRGRDKSPSAFRTISEVANELNVPQHVLRFWESKFNQIKPMKRGGGRRYYRPEDIVLLRGIQRLLYHDGYTIKGAQRLLREEGVKSLVEDQHMTPTRSSHDKGKMAESSDGAATIGIRTELQKILKELEALRSLFNKM